MKVLIVDDHALFRHGLIRLLKGEDDIKIIGEASHGREAIKMARELAPDIVLLDVSMPIMNGIEATRKLVRIPCHPKVLALSMYDEEEYIFSILKAGASGYILKDCAVNDLVKAIHSVHKGESFLSPSVSRRVIRAMVKYLKPGGPADLSYREREILQLIGEGYTSKEIGKEVGISPKTVDVHRLRIMKKLHAKNLIQLVKYAIMSGLVRA